MKRGAYLFFCLLIALSLIACDREAPHYLEGLQGDFQAVLQGERQGVAFEATAQVRRLGDGTRELCLFYLAPEALKDVAVSALLREDGSMEGGTVTLRGMTVPTDTEALQGLLAPLGELLELETPETVQTVEREGASLLLLTFSRGRELALTRKNGVWTPVSYSCGEHPAAQTPDGAADHHRLYFEIFYFMP